MRDGKTRKRRSVIGAPPMQDSGLGACADFTIDRDRVIVGRGPGVDRTFDAPAMSRQHAAIEFSGSGFRLRDLGSTNGTLLGDRFEIGGRRFLLAIEEREREPDAYELKS